MVSSARARVLQSARRVSMVHSTLRRGRTASRRRLVAAKPVAVVRSPVAASMKVSIPHVLKLIEATTT